MMRTAIYARISRDEADQRTGVDRQLIRGREVAEKHGWTVADIFTDNDLSAYNGNDRPGFTSLCEAIKTGRIDAVIVQHQDRIARNVTTFREFGTLCLDADVRIESWSGPIDLGTATGKYQSTIQAATDEHYSDLISEKARAAHQDIADRGEPNGGRRPFGYHRSDEKGDAIRNADGHRTFRVHEDEAPIVVEMYERFLRGDSIRSLSLDLNARQIPTAGGSRWSSRGVRDVLMNSTYIGKRTHKGVEKPGNWQPIVNKRLFEKAQAILRSRTKPPGWNVQKYWLNGLVHCAECRYPMRARPQRGKRRYGCVPDTNQQRCQKGIQAVELEELIGEIITGIYADDSIRQAIDQYRKKDAGDEEVLSELDTIKDRKNQLAESFAMGEIDRGQMAAATDTINARQEELQSQLTTDENLSEISSQEVAETFTRVLESDLPIAVQAKARVANALLESITISPAVPGRSKFDDGRIQLEFKPPLNQVF